MFDVVTFGSACLDVFVFYTKTVLSNKKNLKGVFLPLGEKLEGADILLRSGGGGGNVAATFVSQGLKVAFCGKVGDDFAGKFILDELSKFKVNKSFILKTTKKRTNCSVIFTGKEGKTIIPYRGASGDLSIKEIPLKKLKAKWFYLAPLSGKLKKDFLKIINFAKKENIKIAFSPGKSQMTGSEIKKALKKVDIFILNQEEASLLTGISSLKEKSIFKKIDEWTEGICIMTKGRKGVSVSDGKFVYKAPALKIKVIDETGAGDSFGSGFVSEYIKTGKIDLAIQFATANAAANIEELGAKEGILKKGKSWKKGVVNKKRLI